MYSVGMRLMMISDYRTNIGGIESYIHHTAQLLRKNDREVLVVGLSCKAGIINRLKSFLLVLTAFNLPWWVYILIRCFVYRPQVVRLHSVSRFLGWFPIMMVGCYKLVFPDTKILMMYHDLWYVHPYPSLLTDEKQVLPWSFDHWIDMTYSYLQYKSLIGRLIWYYMATLKYLSLSMIKWMLQIIVDTHLVPSSFMIKYFIDWGLEKDSINVLPHYVVE